jgi:hypothetical protein
MATMAMAKERTKPLTTLAIVAGRCQGNPHSLSRHHDSTCNNATPGNNEHVWYEMDNNQKIRAHDRPKTFTVYERLA